MKKKALILGIETSCDETAAAILEETTETVPNLLSNIVSSQEEIHKKFGGVVPELAARSHIDKIDLIVNRALKKPLIVVNHLEGHALSPKLVTNLRYPYLLLLISGGHSQYLAVKNLGEYKRLGTTIDDALGEAFDKTAKLLGIKFPGGPFIEKFAAQGNEDRFDLPKPIINKGGCNLSFAGLKTAVLKISKSIKNNQDKHDLAASFQKTIEEILVKKTKIAFDQFKKISQTKNNFFVIAGGVAANNKIRNKLEKVSFEENFMPIFPPLNLCGDNAAMIAMVGLEKFKLKQFSKLDTPANPRWQLDKNAVFLKGAGVKL